MGSQNVGIGATFNFMSKNEKILSFHVYFSKFYKN